MTKALNSAFHKFALAPVQWGLALSGTAIALALIALGLAWVSSGYSDLSGWGSFLAVEVLAASALAGGWWLVRRAERAVPLWLAGLLVGAALLRLAAGVLWYTVLPVAGYDSPAENAGYVMADAFERDQTAWELARSEKPLLRAFQGGYRKADQYGGILFVSAAVYRLFETPSHAPLLMILLTAAFSALAIPFTWAFARRIWDARVAGLAAWGLALYPEAVLLGSTQMREAFTIPLTMVAFYGLVRYLQDRSWSALGLLLAALLLYLPFSPPFVALLMVMLGISALALTSSSVSKRVRADRRLLLLLGVVLVLVVAGVWLTWGRLAPSGIGNPVELVGWWLRRAYAWQSHLSENASGWLQKIFNLLPQPAHLPFLVLYGATRPLLPAALADNAAWIWQALSVWRALGWTVLPAFLTYATLRAWLRRDSGAFTRILTLLVWAGILIASYRGGGDQWDNPRYRAALAGLQVALAAWGWVAYRRNPDAWLRRALVAAAALLAWFMPWYLRRYTVVEWPVVDLFKTISLGLATAALYTLWDWAGSSRRPKSVEDSSQALQPPEPAP